MRIGRWPSGLGGLWCGKGVHEDFKEFSKINNDSHGNKDGQFHQQWVETDLRLERSIVHSLLCIDADSSPAAASIHDWA